MLDVSAARQLVLSHARRRSPDLAAVMTASLGLVVAADVPADLDSPPFTKSMMDGYAVRAADAPARTVLEEVPAGKVPAKTVGPGEAVRLFTGAPIPSGADAVVPVEKTTLAGDVVTVQITPRVGDHILPRGAEYAAGATVLPAGTVLTPAAFGLLAAVGRTSVQAYPHPRVCVVATGDELVEANRRPRDGQIRNSNGPMLCGQAAAAGALPRYLGIARDTVESLTSHIREGLEIADVLVLAGGVSAGGLDLVPQVLAGCGVDIHFHHVRMKPGKPLLFGTRGGTLVFGLPGNPVSSFVGFELFVKPALRAIGGHADPGTVVERRPLSEAFAADNNRPTYHPAVFVNGAVRPLPWFGSPDLRGILGADGLIVLPAGQVKFGAGEMVEVIPMGR
jgi:molybdopterin molybdotransferase